MFDLISIGDATIDNFVRIHDAEVRCNINKTNCKLCVDYGEKIAVDRLAHLVAGNAANNAVSSARLKMKTAIYANVGDDASGKQIVDKLKQEGVSNRYIVVNKGMESNLSTVLAFQGERTIFVYHQPWKYQLPELENARWIYFTSLSKSFIESNLLNELTVYLERTGAKVLYNPGTYQIQLGIKKNPRLLSLTELVIVNLEEAKRILGKSEIKKLLKGIVDFGPRMAIITDGQQGSYGFDGDKYFHLGIFPAKLMEMTGAGDAYATGVLAGLFYGKDLKEAMRWGAANGAAVVEKLGPQAGLLTYHAMTEKLKEHSKIVTEGI